MGRLARLAAVAWPAIAAAVLAGCASTGGPYDRGPGGGAPRIPAGPSVDEIIQDLELTEDQMPEVRGVLQASEDERSEIMAKHAGARGPGGFEALREELDDLRARTETMLEPLLTDEQMERYRLIVERAEAERARMEEEARARPPGGPGGGRGGPPGF
jgi:hypothetical protein